MTKARKNVGWISCRAHHAGSWQRSTRSSSLPLSSTSMCLSKPPERRPDSPWSMTRLLSRRCFGDHQSEVMARIQSEFGFTPVAVPARYPGGRVGRRARAGESNERFDTILPHGKVVPYAGGDKGRTRLALPSITDPQQLYRRVHLKPQPCPTDRAAARRLPSQRPTLGAGHAPSIARHGPSGRR
jgi:hypothetical protein